MDDLLELLELPLEVYPEYWAGIRALAREAPIFTAAYTVIAPAVAFLLVRWMFAGKMTFKRAYVGCLALALLVLPGAVAKGGLAILPLAVVVAFAVIQPIWLLYNVSLFAIAALIAWVAARLVCRAAAGKIPAAVRIANVRPRE